MPALTRDSTLDPTRLLLRGGRLCLDFVNTVDPRAGEANRDYLSTYPQLLSWGVHAGALRAEEGRQLLSHAADHPRRAGHVVEHASAFREALHRVLSAAEADTSAHEDDLEEVNRTLAGAMAHARVVPDGEGFTWEWDPVADALDRVLWPVARSAADVLTSGELARVRSCASHDCGWLFLDVSKNRSRRWCTMESCGNRAKVRRHYARRRRAAARS
ncbi:MAG: ABATE domain-containing protein [Gemmatimonadota bacterium]